MNAAILTWLLAAITSWASPSVTPAQAEHVVEMVTAVAYDAEEPPLYQGLYGRALTAVNLASVAAFESRFEERIMLNKCRTWAPFKECDSGKATGLMQVHLGDHGMRLLGGKEEWCRTDAPDCIVKADLVDDPVLQFKTGAHVWRTLGPGAFTKHREASAQAALFVERHPVPVRDVEVMR